MHALAQKLRLKKFKDGDTVFAEGDPFVHHYFVLSGRISCTNKRGDGMRNLVGKCLFRICVCVCAHRYGRAFVGMLVWFSLNPLRTHLRRCLHALPRN